MLSLVNEVVDFYNMLVDDIPIVQLYYIKSGDVGDMINTIDWVLFTIERELDFLDKIGGEFLEKWIVAEFFPDAVIESDNGNGIWDIFKRDEETTTDSPVQTTAAPG